MSQTQASSGGVSWGSVPRCVSDRSLVVRPGFGWWTYNRIRRVVVSGGTYRLKSAGFGIVL
ncbi:hypothetical protein RAB80_003881 [Fusarium oxysporum f. sp. vasinfectum]|nr:hypothetical protein RAB80_003881 [Fusarium oxysporum f. sp. vasinfectum]